MFPECRVPKSQSKISRVFASEMPQEMEDEEEHDEDDSSDDLDDVEKLLNEDDESDFVLEVDQVREVLAGIGVETKTTRHFKGKISSRVWKTVETDVSSCDAEVPRGNGGAEAENEM